MVIEKNELEAIVDDLKVRKDRLEGKETYMKDVPPNYVGVAIYSEVIQKLEGLIQK